MQKPNITTVRNTLSYLVASGLALGLTGCSIDVVSSGNVKAEAIYQDYSASYSEDTQTTSFWGTFRVGGSTGTTVALDGRSSLVVNGVMARPNSILGQHYELTVGQGFVPNVTAVWTDPNGAVYSNTLQIKTVSYAQPPQTMAPLANSYTLFVSAPGLDATETISGRITQDPSGTALSDSFNPASGALTFSSTTMATLHPGPAKLTVIRYKSSSLINANTTGGYGSTSYSVRTVIITLQ